MQLPALDTNIIVTAILVTMGLYGVIAGRQRLRLVILSVYVGVVLAEQMLGAVRGLLGGLGETQLSWLLFGLPIVIFGILSTGFHKGEKGIAIVNIFVGMFTGALIISCALNLMAPDELHDVNQSSFIAMMLQRYHLWLLGLMPIVALIQGFIRIPEKKH